MAMSRKTHEMFIGGNWVKSSSGETVEDINPATGEVIARKEVEIFYQGIQEWDITVHKETKST